MEKDELLKYVDEYLSEHPLPEKDYYAVTDYAYDKQDYVNLVSAVLDRWLTEGKLASKFRDAIVKQTETKYSILTNSGSSANLVAMAVVKDLWDEPFRRYVITCATAFPTTVAPIIQNGFIPLFIDIDPDTLTYNTEEIIRQLEGSEVAGIILAHNLGFAYRADIIAAKCRHEDKWFIEDTCDAFGTKLDGKPVGSFGDLSTLSFFPAHHITTGEGGSVQTNNSKLYRLLQQYINWGRDCWCEPGQSNTCNKRFDHVWHREGAGSLGLPDGYDHKYTFTKVGYNLKMTELQAAFGLSQIEKLLEFKIARRFNYENLYAITKKYDLYVKPYVLPDGCSPFGFPMLASSEKVKTGFVEYLEANGVRTRPLFSGNILRHPMMKNVKYEIAHPLVGSETVMNRLFWIGCQPSVTEKNIAIYEKCLKEYF